MKPVDEVDVEAIAREIGRPGSAELREITMAHCLAVSMQLIAKGEERGLDGRLIEINPSVVKAVDNCMPVKLLKLDQLSVQRVAKHAVVSGDTALAKLGAPNECTRCLAVSYAIVKMVEQKQIDADGTLAVTALAMTLEAEAGNLAWAKATRPKYYGSQLIDLIDQELRRY